MGYLKGFAEARDHINSTTIFDEAVASKQTWRLLLSQGYQKAGIIQSHSPYKIQLLVDGVEREMFKHDVELLCLDEIAPVVRPLFDVNDRVQAMGLGPIRDVSKRAPLRNTMLYVCQVDRIPVEITLLSGFRFRGIITDFTRYEMQVSFTPKLQVHVLRHAVHEMYTQDDVNLCNPKHNETRMKQNSSAWVED